MKEKIQAVIEYLEKELKLLQSLEEHKIISENLITLAVLFIKKAHHHDGCAKARENWKECTCGKDNFLKMIRNL